MSEVSSSDRRAALLARAKAGAAARAKHTASTPPNPPHRALPDTETKKRYARPIKGGDPLLAKIRADHKAEGLLGTVEEGTEVVVESREVDNSSPTGAAADNAPTAVVLNQEQVSVSAESVAASDDQISNSPTADPQPRRRTRADKSVLVILTAS